MMNYYQPQAIEQQLNRLSQLQNSNFNQYQQPQTVVTPVGGIEEVKAFNNYFDGQPHYFLDKANNKIYVKQLNLDGTPSIMTYMLVDNEEKIEYATKEEVENIKNVIENLLKNLGGQANE